MIPIAKPKEVILNGKAVSCFEYFSIIKERKAISDELTRIMLPFLDECDDCPNIDDRGCGNPDCYIFEITELAKELRE